MFTNSLSFVVFVAFDVKIGTVTMYLYSLCTRAPQTQTLFMNDIREEGHYYLV